MGAPYIYDISRLRVKDLHSATYIYVVRRLRVNTTHTFAVLVYLCMYLHVDGLAEDETCRRNINNK